MYSKRKKTSHKSFMKSDSSDDDMKSFLKATKLFTNYVWNGRSKQFSISFFASMQS